MTTNNGNRVRAICNMIRKLKGKILNTSQKPNKQQSITCPPRTRMSCQRAPSRDRLRSFCQRTQLVTSKARFRECRRWWDKGIFCECHRYWLVYVISGHIRHIVIGHPVGHRHRRKGPTHDLARPSLLPSSTQDINERRDEEDKDDEGVEGHDGEHYRYVGAHLVQSVGKVVRNFD